MLSIKNISFSQGLWCNFYRIRENSLDYKELRNDEAVWINFTLKKFGCEDEEKIKELVKIATSQRKF